MPKKTVLLTRPREQSEEVRPLFEAAGFAVEIAPVIEILPPESWNEVDTVLSSLSQFDWVVISSANGARFFGERLCAVRQLFRGKIAAVGPGSLRGLNAVGLVADAVAENHRAEGLVERLADEAKKGKRFLHIRGSRGRDVVQKGLEQLGGRVQEVSFYRSIDRQFPDPLIEEKMRRGEFDYTSVTSSAIAHSLVRLYGEALRATALVSISPLTTNALKSLGYPPQKEAATPTMEGIAALLSAEEGIEITSNSSQTH